MKIIINHSSMVPIYEQLIDQIKTMILNEELKADDSLPSVRTLAKELKISALTVKKAYDYLEEEGFYYYGSWQRNLCSSCQPRSKTGAAKTGN